MKADEKDIFKKVIKHAADKNPATDFTASVMKTIETDLQQEDALKVLLQKEEAVGPSFNFTANVMAGIAASRPQFVYKPIISKKTWYGISAVLAFLAISIFTNQGSPTAAGQTRISLLVNLITQIPAEYLIATVVIAMLLTIDYFINSNRALNNAA